MGIRLIRRHRLRGCRDLHPVTRLTAFLVDRDQAFEAVFEFPDIVRRLFHRVSLGNSDTVALELTLPTPRFALGSASRGLDGPQGSSPTHRCSCGHLAGRDILGQTSIRGPYPAE